LNRFQDEPLLFKIAQAGGKSFGFLGSALDPSAIAPPWS